LINLTDDVDNTKHTVIRFENNKHNDSLTPYSDNVLLPKSNNDNSASTTDHFELDDSSLKADTKHLMELNAIATLIYPYIVACITTNPYPSFSIVELVVIM
jgi:hypothetical protein